MLGQRSEMEMIQYATRVMKKTVKKSEYAKEQ